ncbi:MAG: sigma-70 family RNA polymerase sigma factor [Lachnospiraceae bacterium]|nr:sigma-70 family RNA polymerase sigma factor [Lachnospiraceae bacterium]
MKEYGNAILRLAYTYVHNSADAEDVLQETLIRVLQANPEFENETHEKAYLLRSAANIAKNKILAVKRQETDELNEELIAEEREDLSFVWEAVKSLPEAQREAVHLFYQEGYQTAEIAEILGRNESTVRSDLRRAREALKKILKEEYDFG